MFRTVHCKRATILACTAFAGVCIGATASCHSDSLEIQPIFGVEILSVRAQAEYGWNSYGFQVAPLPSEQKPIDFCDVAITYTHPGLNDTIKVSVWLPLQDEAWNGRFLGQGGGGYAAGFDGSLAPAVSMGYAAANTDAGHSVAGEGGHWSSKSWSLTSPGNVNLVLLQDFASRAVDDMTVIAKEVVRAYYGYPVKYSYWNGCSTGGRQGLMLAQRSPKHYDGILATCPAVNWVTFLVTNLWPQVAMNTVGYFPPMCELTAITQAAIEACDNLDGQPDGVIASPGLCNFDVSSIVGRKFQCDGVERTISEQAAAIANAAWRGPSRAGEREWFGLNHEASLVGVAPGSPGLAKTQCNTDNTECRGDAFPISADWAKQFVLKDPNVDLDGISEAQFFSILDQSRQEYFSLMDTAQADLREFQKHGGKMIVWHGLADQLIPPNGTAHYYDRVLKISPDARDFFRYFEIPGIQHCSGGPGAFPENAFASLVDWVEKEVAPDMLHGHMHGEAGGTGKVRAYCPYPTVALRKGGEAESLSSYECPQLEHEVATSHDEL